MPQITIPLIGEETRRGLAITVSTTKDQYLAGCVVTKTTNSATQTANFYVQKRPGLLNGGAIAAGSPGTAVFVSPSTSNPLLAFGGANSTIWTTGPANAGTITGTCQFITETQISGVTHYLFTSSDGTGWYLVNGATADTAFTGDTHTNTTIDNLSGASGIYVGQKISGTNIVAGTRITARSPDTSTPTSITVDTATTGTTAGVAITKEPIAKIIDADFPSAVGGFAAMDGYVFVMTSTGRIYNSDLNSVISWQPQNYITAAISTDTGMGCIQYNNHIVAFGNESIEFFYNAGNSSGSILASRKEYFSQVGMYAGFGPYNSVCQINNNVFWVGNDMGLYTFNEFAPIKLSEMGMSLGSTNVPPYALSAFRLGVDTIVHVNSSTAAYDKWYSVNTGYWMEPAFSSAGLIIATYPNPTNSTVAYGVLGDTSGAQYTLDTATYQDNGSAYTMTIQTEPKALNGGLPFIIDNINLLADTQSSGSTTLATSADDYANFGTVGVFDLTQQQKNLAGGGYYDSTCAFRLTDSGNNAWRGQALVVTWRPA